jgi:hypothetical protein
MKQIIAAIMAIALTGCGQGYLVTDQDSNSSPATLPPSAIQTIVDTANASRYALGQAPLTQGLSCYLYTVPTSTTAIIGASLTGVGGFIYTGSFNQANAAVSAGLNVLPAALQAQYTTYFVLKCYGTLVNVDNAYHQFSVTSDDGANLCIDGAILNNDGLHAASTVSYVRYLSQGVHSIELDFFQAGGQEALILNQDGKLLSSSLLFH